LQALRKTNENVFFKPVNFGRVRSKSKRGSKFNMFIAPTIPSRLFINQVAHEVFWYIHLFSCFGTDHECGRQTDGRTESPQHDTAHRKILMNTPSARTVEHAAFRM